MYVRNCICFLYKGKDDTVLHLAHLAAVAVDEQSLRRQNRNAQSALNGPIKRVHVLGHHIKILPEMSVKKPKGKLASSVSGCRKVKYIGMFLLGFFVCVF